MKGISSNAGFCLDIQLCSKATELLRKRIVGTFDSWPVILSNTQTRILCNVCY